MNAEWRTHGQQQGGNKDVLAFLKKSSLCVKMSCLPVCVSAHHMCASAHEMPEGIESPGTGVTGGRELPSECWELNPSGGAAGALNHGVASAAPTQMILRII